MQEMDNALAQPSEDNDTPCWTSFQQVVYDTAKASLDKHEKKHQDWFDPNDQILRNLMAKRDQAHQSVLQIRSTRSAVHLFITCQSGVNVSMIDYVMVRKSDCCLVKYVKVISSKECVPQHRMVIPVMPRKTKIVYFASECKS